MRLRHITNGIKNYGKGLGAEVLTYLTVGIIDDLGITYQKSNMLPHSYTLLGLGKMFHNKEIMNEARNLRRKARKYSNQKNQLYNELKETLN